MAKKIYVIHYGIRDSYQVAYAFAEAGYDVTLITSAYPNEFLEFFRKIFPNKYFRKLLGRKKSYLANVNVVDLTLQEVFFRFLGRFFGANYFLNKIDLAMHKSFSSVFDSDNALAVIAYNYNAYRVFNDDKLDATRKILFMCHPHPLFNRKYFKGRIDAHQMPSDSQEVELSYDEDFFARLIAEPVIADEILCASSFTRDTLREYVGGDKRISVIPYGVSADFSTSPIRRSAPNEPLRLIFVGQLSYRKGISTFESIFSSIDFPVELVVVGRGIREINDLSALVENKYVNISMKWDIPFDELLLEYGRADIFLFPSFLEGFGLVILEAMMAGCVPLVSQYGAGHDLIDEAVNGWVIDPDNSKEYTNVLNILNNDRDLLNSIKIKTRERASEFDWAKFRRDVVAAVFDGGGK